MRKILFITLIILVFVPVVAICQAVGDTLPPQVPTITDILSIDWKNITFAEAWAMFIPFATMIWGQIAKLSKSIDDAAPLPKLVIIGVGGFLIAMLIGNQGFSLGGVINNVLLVLAGIGIYPFAKELGNLLPFNVSLNWKNRKKKPAE